jgi:hypothetical protein
LPLAGTHFESSVRICLDDTLQPVAQLVLLSSAVDGGGRGAERLPPTRSLTPTPSTATDWCAACHSVSPAAANGISISGGGGQARRRRRLNADDAWVASAMREGTALAWSADFDAQLVRLGLSYEQYMPDETTFALVLAGVAAPVRCTVDAARRHRVGRVARQHRSRCRRRDASDARLNSSHLRSSGVSGTVWSFGDDVHAARGVVRTGVMLARVGAAVRSVKHAAAKSGCTVDAAGDMWRATDAGGRRDARGARLANRRGAEWRDCRARGSRRASRQSTASSSRRCVRCWARSTRARSGSAACTSCCLSRVARLSDMAGALERLCAEFRDVRVVVLTLLGSVSVLVVVLQRYGIVVRSPDGRNKLRSERRDERGRDVAIGGLDSWSRWIDAQHPAMAFGGASDLFDKLSVLRRTLIAVVRLADLARALRARSSAVTQDANGRRLTFTSSSGVQNELAVERRRLTCR